MTDDPTAELSALRSVMLSEVDAAGSALADFRRERLGRTDDDEHDPDGTPMSAEWSRLDALHRAALARVTEVDAALASVGAGRYGMCERCGQPIPAGRLQALPTATRCVHCAGRR